MKWGAGAMDRSPPVLPRYDRGVGNNPLGAVAFAFLSSTALFVAATFQAAAQRPSVLVRETARSLAHDPAAPN